MKRAILLVALSLVSVAADCSQCQATTQAKRGNVDRVTDAVLVFGNDTHALMVTTNPEIQHLRVLDLTLGRFVDAPNAFFPASIPVGPETRRLAVAPDHDGRVFALDAASDQVFVVRTRTGEKPGVDFTVVDKIATGRAPGDLAAFTRAAGTDLYVSLPESGQLQQILAEAAAAAAPAAPVDPVDCATCVAPADVVVAKDGTSVVVGDSLAPVAHVFARDLTSGALTFVRDLDVGGPLGLITVGAVDVGDGLAPVAIALRTDANIAVALRLERPGFREDKFAVLGSAEVPAYPISAYVPDNTKSATVCCRDLTVESVNAHESTSAWAAVGMANGDIIYLRVDAPQLDKDDKVLATAPRLVRLIDNDVAPLAPGATADTDWSAVGGDSTRRPIVTIDVAQDYGDPPFVPILDNTENLSFIWEAPPPGLLRLPGTFQAGVFTASVDVAERGAVVGDIADIEGDSQAPGCDTTSFFGTISALDHGVVTITGLSADDERCIGGSGALALIVDAANAFVAFDIDGTFLGRVPLGQPLNLPGATITLTANAAGPPQERGSTLHVPLDPHVVPVVLPMSDPQVSVLVGGGGFGSAGFLPTALTGGEMDIPSNVVGELQHARRMEIATASEDVDQLNELFDCDEAESIAGFCLPYK